MQRKAQTFARFIDVLIEQYAAYTPAFAAVESSLSEESIVDIARQIGRAGTSFCRPYLAGRHGWQPGRLAGGTRALVPLRAHG